SNFTNCAVVCLGHVKSSAGYRQSIGIIKARGAARPIGAPDPSRRSSQSCHYPGGGDLTNRTIKGIGDVEIARAIHRDAVRSIKTRGAAAAIRAAEHAGGTGNGCNYSGGSNLSDGTVSLIRHVGDAGAVDGNSPGLPELRGAAGPIGAPVDARRACEGGHYHGSGIRVVKDRLASGTVSAVGIAGESVEVVGRRIIALGASPKGNE